MKKFSSYFLLLLMGLVLAVSSCKDDEPVAGYANPELNAVNTSVQQRAGEAAAISLNANAEAGIQSLTVTANGGTADNVSFAENDNNQLVTYSFPVPADAEEGAVYSLVFTLTDKQAKTATATVTVTATAEPEEPAETITLTRSAQGLASVPGFDAGTNTLTLKAKDNNILDGFVYVNSGQTLKIEPGTVIRANSGQGSGATALIVARGGKIMAEGTAEQPIIFTGSADDLNGSVPDDATALWGGIIILGNAPTNNLSVTNQEKTVEGLPTDDERNFYGGNQPTDNSGVMRYVSVRHGGSVIGADNEINGITLGAVGSGTVLEHLEVFSTVDDGIELFGGTVNLRYLVISMAGDDYIDIDEGYTGSIQNVLVWQTTSTASSGDPRGGEWDGGVGSDEVAQPYGMPKMANLTMLVEDDGSGQGSIREPFFIRDNSGGLVANSIFVNYQNAATVEYRADITSSYHRFEAGELMIKNNIFYNIGGVTDAASFANAFAISNENGTAPEAGVNSFKSYMTSNNTLADPGFGTGSNKFVPSAEAVTTNLATGLAEWGLEDLGYKGAIDPSGTPFYSGWSKTAQLVE